jgi:methylmalonyl-CoA/ethylmalonyl-CoA epimerase
VPEQNVRVGFFSAGETRIELVEPLGPDSPVAGFLEGRGGKSGIHHICFEVEDLDSEMARLRAKGALFVDPGARLGGDGSRIAFIHPKSAGGVLIELCQHAK